jgi:uncharacterized peroxidase-related enzyme
MTAYLFKELQSVTLEAADDTQRAILTKAKEQVGFLPNMYTNMVNVPAFLDTYLHGYGLFREQSDLTASEQEVVFLAISQDNGCDYCTAAHSTLAAKYSGVPTDALNAIRNGEVIADTKLAAIFTMAKEINHSRGRPDTAIVNTFLQAGYSEKHLLAITLAVSVKVLSNYSNHMFDSEVDDAFAEFKVK